ncbi:hypothetical protein H2198_004677 [Neophaeococcomyces mojaviensis]|uniref:Uncharacterized protein n=1 Tax=Neophaeococcomyces mojaviensis TaxID=3383035 RepID=A0ACC3A839_9EURO|nr:hypothetical protein H2198_004677 [Knufia sp. JES_112]
MSSFDRFSVDRPIVATLLTRSLTDSASRQTMTWDAITLVTSHQLRKLRVNFLDKGFPIHKLVVAITNILRISINQTMMKIWPQGAVFLQHVNASEAIAVQLVRDTDPEALYLYLLQLEVLSLFFKSLAQHLLRRLNDPHQVHHDLIENHGYDPILSLAHHLSLKIHGLFETLRIVNRNHTTMLLFNMVKERAWLHYALARAKTAVNTRAMMLHGTWTDTVLSSGPYHETATLQQWFEHIGQALLWVELSAERKSCMAVQALKWRWEFFPLLRLLQIDVEDRRFRNSDVVIPTNTIIA